MPSKCRTRRCSPVKKDGIEKYCKYCEKAKSLSDCDTVLCDVYGVVAASHKCRRFSYDPLKREPKRIKKTPELEFVDLPDEENNKNNN